MVNLIKYQAGYNAAAKMISMAQDMLDSLMNMTR
jgi:flagellar hook-associated protein FlgK